MKSSKKIAVFVADEIHPKGLSVLREKGFNVVPCYSARGELSNDKLIDFMTSSRAGKTYALIIRSVRRIDRDFINKLRRSGLKLICTASSGTDHIDVAHCKKNGIKVLNTPEANYISAAEHTFAIILAISKNIIEADSNMKKGKFSAHFKNFELLGKTIGIIGVGRVGSYVARIARSFNMRILGNDIKKSLVKKYKWIKFLPLNKLLQSSDIVTVHTPLDKTTINLLNRNNLKLLRGNAILINCARGGIISENDLVDFLKKKKFYYAGLDVYSNEPWINPKFRTLQNIVLTPHLAGKTQESKERISVHLAEGIETYFSKTL